MGFKTGEHALLVEGSLTPPKIVMNIMMMAYTTTIEP